MRKFIFVFLVINNNFEAKGFDKKLWTISKQYSPICDVTECCVPSGAILFA